MSAGNEVVNCGGEVLVEMDHRDGDESPDAAVPVKAVDKIPGGQRLQLSQHKTGSWILRLTL